MIDMDIAGHSTVDSTGDVTKASHNFVLPEPGFAF